jgi:hypothetical protein
MNRPPPQNATLRGLAFGTKAASAGRAFAAPRAFTSSISRLTMPNTRGFVGTILKYGFYTSLFALVLFLVLVVVHYTFTPIFSFTADNGIITIPTTQDYQMAFTAAVATVDISANFVNPSSCGFTLIFDIFLQGDFKSTTAPRVLTYRNLVPINIPLAPANFTPESEMVEWFPNTNFIVWIDPEKNDLYAGVITKEPNEASVLQMSAPVINIPIRKPFRATFTVSPDFMEIYINARLEQTIAITSTVLECQMPFFSPTTVCDQSIFIANMCYWSRVLSPGEIRINGPNTNSSVFASIT